MRLSEEETTQPQEVPQENLSKEREYYSNRAEISDQELFWLAFARQAFHSGISELEETWEIDKIVLDFLVRILIYRVSDFAQFKMYSSGRDGIYGEIYHRDRRFMLYKPPGTNTIREPVSNEAVAYILPSFFLHGTQVIGVLTDGVEFYLPIRYLSRSLRVESDTQDNIQNEALLFQYGMRIGRIAKDRIMFSGLCQGHSLKLDELSQVKILFSSQDPAYEHGSSKNYLASLLENTQVRKVVKSIVRNEEGRITSFEKGLARGVCSNLEQISVNELTGTSLGGTSYYQ